MSRKPPEALFQGGEEKRASSPPADGGEGERKENDPTRRKSVMRLRFRDEGNRFLIDGQHDATCIAYDAVGGAGGIDVEGAGLDLPLLIALGAGHNEDVRIAVMAGERELCVRLKSC